MAAKCGVCFDRKANYIIVPCGHLCLCSKCRDIVVSKNKHKYLGREEIKCVICNSMGSIHQVFIPNECANIIEQMLSMKVDEFETFARQKEEAIDQVEKDRLTLANLKCEIEAINIEITKCNETLILLRNETDELQKQKDDLQKQKNELKEYKSKLVDEIDTLECLTKSLQFEVDNPKITIMPCSKSGHKGNRESKKYRDKERQKNTYKKNAQIEKFIERYT
jgi:hypothetical protein